MGMTVVEKILARAAGLESTVAGDVVEPKVDLAMSHENAALVINLTVGSRVIFVTGSREPATIERINLDHPFAVLFKPVSQEQLSGTINAARRASGHGL